MTYENLIQDMIDSQATIIGAQAIEIARRVRGLQVEDDGTVQAVGQDPVSAADELAMEYQSRLGNAADRALRHVASQYEDELELPTSLQ